MLYDHSHLLLIIIFSNIKFGQVHVSESTKLLQDIIRIIFSWSVYLPKDLRNYTGVIITGLLWLLFCEWIQIACCFICWPVSSLCRFIGISCSWFNLVRSSLVRIVRFMFTLYIHRFTNAFNLCVNVIGYVYVPLQV